MTEFLGPDVLLSTETARQLYHGTAEALPILDYHCHLSPREIAEDRTFENLTQIWLEGDHYKWRLMRAAGVPEDCITGGASDWEKFAAFAQTMPLLIGNPVFHWSHLELQRVFGISAPLTPETARSIYDQAGAQLKDLSARRLMRRFGVKAVCTTDSPADDLRWHAAIAADASMEISVLPAFRPDGAVNIEAPGFPEEIRRLGAAAGREPEIGRAHV